MRIWHGERLRRAGRGWGRVASLLLFSVLILGTRAANHNDVFVQGKIFLVDADCYARMSRARLVVEHPGTIVRHHSFENYPEGIRPHTTAPLDYLIVLLATMLRPFSAQALDLAGALISPLLALLGGWFLWWWSGRLPAVGRLLLLLIYGLSGILVHGTALGRPDQQSLLIVLLLVALAAELRQQEGDSRGWSVASGLCWGLAFWVSLYEPLVLLGGWLLFASFLGRARWWARARWSGWATMLGVLILAAVIERRWPEWPGTEPFFASWAATIGEVQHVGLTNPSWLDWGGGLLLVSPVLLGLAARRRVGPLPLLALLGLVFLLTLWQARWAYFFILLFLLSVPAQLSLVRPNILKWLTLAFALLPFLFFWDARLWPNEQESGRRAQERRALLEWRAAAEALRGAEPGAILAPWWLAPVTAYWSGHPVVAGSSHESLPGIVDSARFFLTESPEEAAEIVRARRVRWVLAAEGERVTANSAALLGRPVPEQALAWKLDRFPAQVPSFMKLSAQSGTCKIYRVIDRP